MSPPNGAVRHAPALVLLLIIGIVAALMIRNGGPEPKPATAPAEAFSAERALAAHRDVLGTTPHPVGSAAHDAVLQRLVAKFQSLGYETSIQRTFACTPYGSCAPVANVIAKHAGASGDVLLLTAHYDSVPAAPGATDDGIGVATMLEVARAIRGDKLRNPVTFLITDAEEAGLLGAEGFVADPSVSRGVSTVINVEARGTSGPSYLFETSRHNRWLMPIVARALPRPNTSSFFASVYELLPNDTDLTVFKRTGWSGINFANIGGVSGYHDALDDDAHLSPRTLQQDGDSVLALTRAFGNTELRQMTDDSAVWFDVLSSFVVWWPQRWSLLLAIVALVIILIAAAVRVWDGKVAPGFITAGVASFFISLLGAFLIGLLGMWIGGLRSLGATWVAQPGPIVAAMWLIGIGMAIVTSKRLHPYAGFDGLFFGHALCWCASAIGIAIVMPGAAYLAVVPAMALAISAIVRAAREAAEGTLVIICGAITALLFFPLALTLYDALGQPSLPIVAVLVALVATTFAPLIAGAELRRALIAAIVAAVLACVAMALVLPPYTPESPQRISLRYVDGDKGPRWQADGLTPAVHRAAAFDIKPVGGYEWLRRRPRLFEAPAPALGLPPVTVTVLRDVKGPRRELSLLVRSPRGASRVTLVLRAPLLMSMRINGVAPPPRTGRDYHFFADGWHYAAVRGASEMRVDLFLKDASPVDAIVSDSSPGLPAQGATLARARDGSNAVASDDGDTTVTARRIRL